MKRSTLTWIGLTTVGLILAGGCAARAPQRSPVPGNTALPPVTGSTTGDADACAVALGNVSDVGYRGNATTRTGPGAGMAPGTTTRPGPGTTTPPATTAPGTTGTMTPGTNVAPGTAAGTAAGTTAAGRTETTANGILIGNIALVALPSADNMPLTPGTTAAPGQPGGTLPGTTAVPAPAPAPGTTAAPASGGPTAVQRIQSACPKVVEIRVVNNAADRAKLAAIATSLRRGEAVTRYMDDIVRINRGATTIGGAATPGIQGGTTSPGVPSPTRTPGTTTPGAATTPGNVSSPTPGGATTTPGTATAPATPARP